MSAEEPEAQEGRATGSDGSSGPGVSLTHVRAEIDRIDEAIVSLMAARERWVTTAGALKADTQAVRAPDRVEAVVERVRSLARDKGASPAVAEATYRAMIHAFIDLELTVHETERRR